MRNADVLLLLHGVEPICAEYIPSKMYEYLWMQRPILALVHRNSQMADLLVKLGHRVIQTGETAAMQTPDSVTLALSAALDSLLNSWNSSAGLPDSKNNSAYTTRAATVSLQAWVDQV
jgi:hypothetical protein